jgi:hypothetical protein
MDMGNVVGFAIDAALSNGFAVMEAREKMSSTPIVEVGDMWEGPTYVYLHLFDYAMVAHLSSEEEDIVELATGGFGDEGKDFNLAADSSIRSTRLGYFVESLL